jgi:hypothetical protein
MRERAEQILKILCAVLGLALAVQLGKLAIHSNALAGVTIPDLPSLPADTNVIAAVVNRPAKPDTNIVSKIKDLKTNATPALTDTNAVSKQKPKVSDTSNSAPSPVVMASAPAATSAPPTNSITLAPTNVPPTNAIASNATNANPATNKLEASTNAIAAESANTNSISTPGKKRPKRGGDLPPGMLMAGGAGGKAPKLTPEIQARVDRITESEIFGPVMHPMPMALLGIAGNSAFLRAPSGQTGLVKEGEDLGEIKLLRIGVNRVLVEQNGEKKELMIFAGLGGESLLPKPNESSDETTNRK